MEAGKRRAGPPLHGCLVCLFLCHFESGVRECSITRTIFLSRTAVLFDRSTTLVVPSSIILSDGTHCVIRTFLINIFSLPQHQGCLSLPAPLPSTHQKSHPTPRLPLADAATPPTQPTTWCPQVPLTREPT